MYGFVYIWFDRWHKMFYIGSHWGTFDDGYICSSDWMKRAYKKRPQDFKRRILTIVDSKKNLLDEEHRWLQMIDDSDLHNRYYNIKKNAVHWSRNEQMTKSVSEKVSATLKRRYREESEFRASHKKGRDKLRGVKQAPEIVANRVAKNTGKKRTEELKERMRSIMLRREVPGQKRVVIDGILYNSIGDASRKTGIDKKTISERIRSGKYAHETL